VLAVAVDEAGRRLYSAGIDAAVRVWDLEVGLAARWLVGGSVGSLAGWLVGAL
jgi:hypothetical protein